MSKVKSSERSSSISYEYVDYILNSEILSPELRDDLTEILENKKTSFYINKIRPLERKIINYVLENSECLEYLDLSNSRYNGKRLENLVQSIICNDKLPLTDLNLSNTRISDDDIPTLCRLIDYKAIKNINLSGNQFTTRGIRILCEFLEENDTLESLDLSNIKITSNGIEIVSEFLEENDTLKTLNLSNTNLGNKGFSLLADALKINKSIRELDISDNHEDVVTLNIMNFLLSSNILERVNIREDNDIFSSVYKMFSHYGEPDDLFGIINSETIMDRFVFGCKTSDDDPVIKAVIVMPIINIGTKFAEILKENTFTKKLSLYSPYISDEDVFEITEALKYNSTLEEFGVFSPNLTDESAVAFTNLIQEGFFSLKKLFIEKGNISYNAAKNLYDAFKEHCSDKELYFLEDNLFYTELDEIYEEHLEDEYSTTESEFCTDDSGAASAQELDETLHTVYNERGEIEELLGSYIFDLD